MRDGGTLAKAERYFTILAHIAVLLGIPFFFYQQWEAERSDAVKATLTYVQRFEESDMVAARLALFDQWKRFPMGLMKAKGADLSSAQDFAMKDMAVHEGQGDKRVSEALFRFESFFTELARCEETGVCARNVADQHFREFARRLSCLYGLYFADAEGRLGVEGFGSGIREVAADATACGTKPP